MILYRRMGSASTNSISGGLYLSWNLVKANLAKIGSKVY